MVLVSKGQWTENLVLLLGSSYGTTHASSYFKTYSTILPRMTRFE